MRNLILPIIAVGILALSAAPGEAQPRGERPVDGAREGGPGEGEGGERRGPPQEAFQVCDGAHDGESCAFESPRGTVNGTCGAPPRASDFRLVCMPEGGPPGRGRGGDRGQGGGR